MSRKVTIVAVIKRWTNGNNNKHIQVPTINGVHPDIQQEKMRELFVLWESSVLPR